MVVFRERMKNISGPSSPGQEADWEGRLKLVRERVQATLAAGRRMRLNTLCPRKSLNETEEMILAPYSYIASAAGSSIPRPMRSRR